MSPRASWRPLWYGEKNERRAPADEVLDSADSAGAGTPPTLRAHRVQAGEPTRGASQVLRWVQIHSTGGRARRALPSRENLPGRRKETLTLLSALPLLSPGGRGGHPPGV